MFFSLLLSSLLTFVELNTENLFDTRHDSLKLDLAYTPDGANRWSPARYWRKVNGLAKEIIALGDHRAMGNRDDTLQTQERAVVPDLVALCEVENDSVLYDLTRRSLLRGAGYEYVMTNSPDERGIDVALLYQPASFMLVRTHAVRIRRLPKMRPTRDLLYACGVLANSDTLHVFVVHAPSRRGGEKPSRPYRLQVASQLAASVDSVYRLSPHAKIVVAGDFNDYYDSPALDSLCRHSLVNISKRVKGRNGVEGTYTYQGQWNSLDHLLCSPAMAGTLYDCRVGDLPFLLESDQRYGGKKPYRTFIGPRYHGGYSDHLPLVARFKLTF